MKITAITKFKNGVLFEALREAGWSQIDLSRESGLSNHIVGNIINMKSRKRIPTDHLNKIQSAFANVGIFLDVLEVWPESFSGFKENPVVTETRDIDLQVLDYSEASYGELQDLYDKERNETIDCVLSTLTLRERAVVEQRFLEGKTLRETADCFKVKPQRVMQIEKKAFRKLKHPTRQRILENSFGIKNNDGEAELLERESETF